MTDSATAAGAADLHTHTTASDGLLSPAELVAEAIASGLSAIAVTDHDTVDGLAGATTAAGTAIQVIPGIELATTIGDAEAHILGYFIDPSNELLSETLESFRGQRRDRMRRMVDRLNDIGVATSFARVMEIAGMGSVGRPHIGRAMVEHGHVASVGEAFDRYLSAGRPGFVPREEVSPEECIRLIMAVGGVSVLAHPFLTGDPDGFARRLKPAGLVGFEVEYGSYDTKQRSILLDIARRHDLIPTGGSDYHGPEHRERTRLGDGQVPMGTVAKLERLARR